VTSRKRPAGPELPFEGARDDRPPPPLVTLTVSAPGGGPKRKLRVRAAEVTIGSSDRSDVTLDHTGVAPDHAVLLASGSDGIVVVDRGSPAGTEAGGERVRGERRLKPGETIRIAGVQIAVQVERPGPRLGFAPCDTRLPCVHAFWHPEAHNAVEADLGFLHSRDLPITFDASNPGGPGTSADFRTRRGAILAFLPSLPGPDTAIEGTVRAARRCGLPVVAVVLGLVTPGSPARLPLGCRILHRTGIAPETYRPLLASAVDRALHEGGRSGSSRV
jgi:hypothetical protein